MSFRTRLLAAATFVSIAVAATSAQSPQTRTDEYTRHELLPPDTSSVKMTLRGERDDRGRADLRRRDSRRRHGERRRGDRHDDGRTAEVRLAPTAITVTLARPVPSKGQGRIRITKTIKNAAANALSSGVGCSQCPSAPAVTIRAAVRL